MDLTEYEKLEPHHSVEHAGRRIYFYTPNSKAAWRVTTLFTKEPDTIEWIAGFRSTDVLVDIGANVGMYTVWAAATRGVRVFAFEPESQNYAILNRNVFRNGLDKLVQSYCLALSDQPGLSSLYLSEFAGGGSCHSFGAALDHHNRARSAPFAQGCMADTLDRLVASAAIPAPTHVKIDVDGLEDKVVAGATATLTRPEVRSVLIEINTHLEEHQELVDRMLELGFDYDLDQVDAAQRKEGAFAGVGNYVFRR
jgi:FkbM family methyltransferase